MFLPSPGWDRALPGPFPLHRPREVDASMAFDVVSGLS